MTSSDNDAARAARIACLCDEVSALLDSIGNDETLFSRSALHQRALSSLLAQIGEISHHLSPDFKVSIKNDAAYWKSVQGLRNIVAHDYDCLKMPLLFEIAVDDVSGLKRMLLTDDTAARIYEEDSQADSGVTYDLSEIVSREAFDADYLRKHRRSASEGE